MAPKDTKPDYIASTLERDHPDHVHAIGMISIENANMEHSLASLFGTMLFISLPVAHAIYLTPKSAIARIEIFENAARRGFGPKGNDEHRKGLRRNLKRVMRIAERARTVVGKRHGIIHDAWGVDGETGAVQRYPLQKPGGETVVPVETLKKIIREFRELNRDIQELRKEFKANPPTLINLAGPS
jgi:hypothetical protein